MSYIKLNASEFSRIFYIEASKLPYNEQARYHLYGIYHYEIEPDLGRLSEALQVTIDTNYNLRSNFKFDNNIFEQVIHNYVASKLIVETAEDEDTYQNILSEHISSVTIWRLEVKMI